MAGEAPAIQQARTDANTAWPRRNKGSDGTWGDTSHQARKSDHNTGDAIDITHDPANGPSGDVIAAYAIRDPRVKYVIWNKRIYSRDRPGWRPYSKWQSMPHDHHVHISVTQAARADTSPWGWTQVGPPPPIDVPGETTFESALPPPPPPPKPKAKRAAPGKGKGKRRTRTADASVTGPRHIYDGEASVLLGTAQRMAAHVESPHTGGGKVAKGSPTVFVGKRQLAFARLGDPTTDGLNVKTGHEAIFIG